ncbi:gas vesicle protein [Streptomyces sp. AK010]|nr:gas vesicle protein [Streptomyces sp. AK010]
MRTGPRHAAPKKPLFTRFNRPAGKAIAMAAMPTAVLMGMGFTSTLAIADSDTPAAPTSKSLTADEYKDCVAALEDSDKDAKGDASASPTPSPSASDGATDEKDDQGDTAPKPSPSGGTEANNGGSSSSDSGSDDEAEPKPTPSTSAPATGGDDAAATPSPSPSESDGNILEDIGDAIGGIFDGGSKDAASPSPTPSASASQSTEKPAEDASGTQDTAEKATGTVEDTVKDTTDKASDTVKDTGKTVEDTTKAVEKAAEDATEKAKEATASPSPSPSATTDADDCPAATDAEGGVDNKVPLPDDPWFLNASSLTLKGADYKGVVEVRTANGTVKKVLKYVISGGTDIGDLHQTVQDKQSGKTYHVQAAKGSTSTIRDGDTVMYTESISGNLLGLIPITFDPEHPPPLNIPLIYFTNVRVQQAGQFGGTLHVPGLHNFVTG